MRPETRLSETPPEQVPHTTDQDLPSRRSGPSSKSTPDRDIDRLNLMRRKPFGCAQACAVDGMNVGAAVEKHFHNVSRRSRDGSVQRRTAGAVSPIQQRGIRIEKFAYMLQVSCLSRRMYGVILSRLGLSRPTPAFSRFFEQRCNRIMTTLLRHIDQTATVVSVPFRVSSER